MTRSDRNGSRAATRKRRADRDFARAATSAACAFRSEPLERRTLLSAAVANDGYFLPTTPTVAPLTSAFSPTVASLQAAALTTAGFQIDVVFPDNTLTASQQSAFTTAAARWSTIITGDVPDVGSGRWGMPVDDVRILASAPRIDGPGGVLGQAGPNYLRPGSTLPIDGVMEFDTADVASMERNGTLVNVILHEMGHVLGFGTIWDLRGLITGAGSSNPRFTGAAALGEYKAIFGGGSSNETGIPVENSGGAGTADGHWRESTFRTELMTGYAERGAMPLSRITAAQFADLGYSGVDLNAADSFNAPSGTGNRAPNIVGLNASANPVAGGSNFMLVATGVTDPTGPVASVSFYREANGLPGLQVFSPGGDALVGTDITSSDGFQVVTAAPVIGGTSMYYAQAVDNLGRVSNVAVTPVSITGTPTPTSGSVPSTPDLLDVSDTGVSPSDNRTSLNNATHDVALRFSVGNTVPGATVTLYADSKSIGSATASGSITVVQTSGTAAIAQGVRKFTARQALPGQAVSAASGALSVTIDTVAPGGNVIDVSPDPRNTPVSALTIAFTEPVVGFSLVSLSLHRNGGGSNNLLGGDLSLASADGGTTWTLQGQNLSTVTATPGTYVLTVSPAGITDFAGNALAGPANDTWTVTGAATPTPTPTPTPAPTPTPRDLTITRWQSAATHGAPVGEAALDIPDDGSFSEPRLGGVTRLLVTFNQAVDAKTFVPSAVSLAGVDAAGKAVKFASTFKIAASLRAGTGNTVGVITFSKALPDIARYRVTLAATVKTPAGAATLSGDQDREFVALLGDVTGDLVVDAADLTADTLLNGTAPVRATDPAQVRADVSHDGKVNVTDRTLITARLTHNARAVPPLPAPATVASVRRTRAAASILADDGGDDF